MMDKILEFSDITLGIVVLVFIIRFVLNKIPNYSTESRTIYYGFVKPVRFPMVLWAILKEIQTARTGDSPRLMVFLVIACLCLIVLDIKLKSEIQREWEEDIF